MDTGFALAVHGNGERVLLYTVQVNETHPKRSKESRTVARSTSTSNKAQAQRKQSSSGASQRKRAVPPAEKQARKKLGAAEAAAQPALIDDGTRRNIAGIVCLVLGLALLLIVVWPTNAVVAAFMANVMRQGLGVGAYILPLMLMAIAATFLARFDSQRMPARVVVGLALVFIGLLVLLALFTPGALGDNGPTSQLFAVDHVVTRGGFVGAGPAYLGLMLLGLPVSVVVTLGIMVIGVVIIGFSVRKIAAVVQRKREEMLEREEEEFGVAPDAPYVPVTPSSVRTRRSKANSAANTQLIGADPRATRAIDSLQFDESSNANTMLLDERRPTARTMPTMSLDDVQNDPEDEAPVAFSPTGARIRPDGGGDKAGRAITRKLGRRNGKSAEEKPKPEPAAATSNASDDEDAFTLPSMSLLKVSKSKRKSKAFEEELAETARSLQQTIEDFGIMATVVDWVAGPTVTLFEVDLPPGVRVSRITNLQDDIALALAAPGVRIFAPIPGTHYVGIEVPNATRENVLLGDVLKDVSGGPLMLAIGKDVEGNAIICDLAKMPHLLIGGTTGSGKSVGINAMIMSMLMRATPDQVRFIMIDPKRVEFAPYDGIPHLYVPVVTEPKEAASALSWGVAEMERRLKLFSKIGVRNIGTYNARVAEEREAAQAANTGEANVEEPSGTTLEELPYIVIIIDELADLMMNVGKEVEFSISRIAQLARAAGIHLIVATQRPSANVVTGLIKANITNRMAFNVASGLDSRVILDTSGAESLIGNGDLLLSKPEYPKPVRIQGCYTSDEEIEAVVAAVKEQGEPDYHSEILQTNVITLGDTMPDGSGGSGGSDDPLIWEAAEIVVASGLGSTSNIQRKLKVGYSRAGRIMDMLEEKGVVGPPNGSKPRDVLVDAMELETLKAFEAADEN